MIKKVFLMNQFGSPFDWNDKWIDNVQHLGDYGYDFIIFTPNKLVSKGNVKVIPMTIHEFNWIVEKTCGVNPKMYITPNGIPNFHITDFIVALGEIFKDYTKEYEFWGATGFDDIFGRLDHFIKDSELESCDIFSDDVGVMNGNFLLMRNTEKINTIFKIMNWQEIFTQGDCKGCVGEGEHRLYSPEEYQLNKNLDYLKSNRIRFLFPKYYAFHSYDRLSIHDPKPQLEIKDDNSLWEIIPDPSPPKWEHFHKIGREIGYFHFNSSKIWPL